MNKKTSEISIKTIIKNGSCLRIIPLTKETL